MSLTIARQLDDILHRLQQLEAASRVGYAKSSYTPTYLGTTTPGVTTYTTQQGWYTRIGNEVFVNGIVVWTAATGTGSALVSLPFILDINKPRATGAVRTSAVTFANGSMQVFVSSSVQGFTLESPLTNALSTNVAVEAAGNIQFSLWYPIA